MALDEDRWYERNEINRADASMVPEYYPLFLRSLKSAFIIFAALCFAGIFASLARGKVRMI